MHKALSSGSFKDPTGLYTQQQTFGNRFTDLLQLVSIRESGLSFSLSLNVSFTNNVYITSQRELFITYFLDMSFISHHYSWSLFDMLILLLFFLFFGLKNIFSIISYKEIWISRDVRAASATQTFE